MFNKKITTILFVVTLLFILLIVFNEFITDPFVHSSVERGEEIYNQSCMQCHGENGQGRKMNTATTLNNQEFLTLASDKLLMEVISEGREGTKMPSFHVNYGENLTEEQIGDVVSYMRSWHKRNVDMETPEQITGDPKLGRELYKSNCLSCHGKGVGPSVVNKAFLEQVSDEFLWDTIAYGRSNTAMGPSLKGTGGVRQLTQNEISAIVSYLRNMED
ncbi:c-type cytochrome [Radiobacillus sp. PE A8.2]|uniref:c-type cytochrome n=1 Tax=Radiobacillus sp. PE A8.2 TaxID=3380349 RepID=UPI00388FD93E